MSYIGGMLRSETRRMPRHTGTISSREPESARGGSRTRRLDAERFLLLPALPIVANGVSATMLDLSTSGARIRHRNPVGHRDLVHLEFRLADTDLRLSGRVVWSRLAAGSDEEQPFFVTGVDFAVPHVRLLGVIVMLCARGEAVRMNEMRRFERYKLDNPIIATFAPGGTAVVRDLSRRGMRVETSRPLLEGGRSSVMLCVAGNVVCADARVVWSRPKGISDRFESGIEIEGGTEPLHRAIEALIGRGTARLDMAGWS